MQIGRAHLELQSTQNLVSRLLLLKNKTTHDHTTCHSFFYSSCRHHHALLLSPTQPSPHVVRVFGGAERHRPAPVGVVAPLRVFPLTGGPSRRGGVFFLPRFGAGRSGRRRLC